MAIRHEVLARFVLNAIKDAFASGAGSRHGMHVRGIDIYGNGDVRFDLDDGSRVLVEVQHRVPPGYFGTPRDDGTAVDPDGEPGA